MRKSKSTFARRIISTTSTSARSSGSDAAEELQPMRYGVHVLVLAMAALMSGSPALAHHSFAAEYDSEKPIRFAGSLTKVEWTNPHVHFYVDVKNDRGGVVNWNVELGPPLI